MPSRANVLVAAISIVAFAAAPLGVAQSPTDYMTAPSTLTVEDEAEMTLIIVRLNHALDAADYALYASLFAEDAEFVSGFGIAKGREEIAASLEMSRPFITNKRHVAANFLFSGGGDRAVVTTYLIVFEREVSVGYVGSAINTDTFERRAGRWELVRHDSELDPSTARAMAAVMESVDGQ